ncbi:MAG TPA: hypothetical protein VD969_03820 [Symbiobacteriaceae bacterium]|nr:hypothetical protein [Symbiobacteriaceae bacterium]
MRRLSALLLTVSVLIGGCALKREAVDPCSVRGLAQAALPALLPLPAWPVPAPETAPAALGSAAYATLYEGARAKIIMDGRWGDLHDSIKQMLAEQPVQLVRKGVWRAVWPEVLPCLAGRPILRLGYSRANRLEPPVVALLPFRLKTGEQQVPTNALWIAPSRSKGEPTWIIATAIGPLDQRLLIYRQPNAGYTLDGPITIMAMNSTAAARTLAADLGARLAGHAPGEARAAAQAAAEAAAENEAWPQAADAYERLLVATEREAREPGPPQPGMEFFAKEYQVVELSPPEVLLEMARADMAAGRTVYGAREALLHASYLAEEQGQQELLGAVRAAIAAFIEKDRSWSEMQHRLAELEPGNAEHWWKLAEYRMIAAGFEPQPAVAVAEAVGGADPGRAADLYLRMAGEAVDASTADFRPPQEKQMPDQAARLLDEALRRQPDHPYGRLLKGARESRLGNHAGALRWLEAVDGPAAAHERAIAGRSTVAPVLTLDLFAAPSTMADADLKSAYRMMGMWTYAPRMPAPPRQEAVWAPSGRWLATTCTRFTGVETRHETDICLAQVPEGTVHRIAARPYQMEWAGDRLVYSRGEDGLWFAAPGGAPRQLAPEAHDIAVAPDGRRVAFSGGDGLWVVDPGVGAPRRVTDGRHSRPLWSPDGRELFFAAERQRPVEHMVEQMIYRVPVDRSAAPAEVGRRGMISLIWFNISALRWWEPGETLLVRHSTYRVPETAAEAALLPLSGAEPVTMQERAPAELRERVHIIRQIPDRQRELIWLLDGPRLVPVPVGAGATPPRTIDVGSWRGFTEPAVGVAAFAPGGSAALAYTYSFGAGTHLFMDDGRLKYLGQVELGVLGALNDEAYAGPLEAYRQRALPGWPVSWSPDGRYLAWVKGDRLLLFALHPDALGAPAH